MDNSSIITRQGTVTIPKVLRDTFDYSSGTRTFWYEMDGFLIISKEKIEAVEDIFV